MNVTEVDTQEVSEADTGTRKIYRNAFRQGMVKLHDINKVNFDSYPVFEIKPTTDPKVGSSKFNISYTDPDWNSISFPMPDTLTDDVTLSDGDWIIAGAELLINCRKCTLKNVLKRRFLIQVRAYVAELVANVDKITT